MERRGERINWKIQESLQSSSEIESHNHHEPKLKEGCGVPKESNHHYIHHDEADENWSDGNVLFHNHTLKQNIHEIWGIQTLDPLVIWDNWPPNTHGHTPPVIPD